MAIQQNESLMGLGHVANADRGRIDRLRPLGPQIQDARAGLETVRHASAATVLTLRDELNAYLAKVGQSAGRLVALNQQFVLHASDAFGQARDHVRENFDRVGDSWVKKTDRFGADDEVDFEALLEQMKAEERSR